MLTGKTTIELTDVNTGEKKVYEDHNMVTNALKYIFRQDGIYKDPTKLLVSFYPYYQTLLGGLLLFDNTIDENNGDTIFAPTSAEMIGSAVYNVASTDNVIGTYNVSESYYNSNERKMKYVYDFSTNQANGIIKSVCLTSDSGGYASYGNPNIPGYKGNMKQICDSNDRNIIYSDSDVGQLLFINMDNNSAFYCKVNSSSEAIIYERECSFKSVSLFSDPRYTRPKTSTTYVIDLDAATYTKSLYDKKNNTVHILGYSSTSLGNGKTIKVSKIDLTTGTVENYNITNNTGYIFYLYLSYAYDGYIYGFLYSTGIAKFDTKGIQEPKIIGNCDSDDSSGFIYSTAGRIYIYRGSNASTRQVNVYNPERDTFYKTGTLFNCPKNSIEFIGSNDMYMHILGNSSAYNAFFLKSNYLATINNLETPITKTNTNTMKVIYTIQET